ncbi:MAG: peptidase MA family metallohydrolase [Dehalococcoidia bacterium]
MRRLAALLAIMAALTLGWAFATPAAAAQAGIAVTGSSVENRFPEGLLFRLAASSDSPITEVRLRYKVLPEGILSSDRPDFQPDTAVDVSFTLEGNAPPRIYLAPGSVIRYFWELTDEAGNEFATDPATVTYDDIRFDWRVMTAGVINLHWYQGSEADAREMLEVARSTFDELSSLLGAQVEFPVHVWLYASADDMRPALVRRSESFERSVITAGERVSEDTVLVLGSAGALDTLRHELAHIVTGVAGEGPFGGLPAWLDEGTAVYAQADPGGFGSALEQAVDRGNLLSLRSISSPPGDPAVVSLFYGQSWSVVSHLVDTYGAEKFARLFATFKEGATSDDALMAVYGFDQDGLEDEWRASLGLSPRERPSAAPEGEGVASQAEGDGGTSVGLIAGLIAGVLALAAAIGLGGYLIARRLP